MRANLLLTDSLLLHLATKRRWTLGRIGARFGLSRVMLLKLCKRIGIAGREVLP